MTDDNRAVVRVSQDSAAAIKKYAEKQGIPVGDAADKLIGTAISRLASLARYTKNNPDKKRAAKPKAAKKAKKASASNGAAAHA